ncbi:MAG: helix-turn-helix transcriptional regulator [Bacteroidota bacterium]|jgi:transcriptional regulator with XRE-family HTH domain
MSKIYFNFKIKEFREQLNLSQEYVAIQMEMSVKDYKKIERGNGRSEIIKIG